VIDLHLGESIRIVTLYAPASKSWKWTDLSSFTSTRCVVMGDFTGDLEKDGDKADSLLEWMDSRALRPFFRIKILHFVPSEQSTMLWQLVLM
jgi:hypothetical protein